MKKLIALILALVLCLSLCACGGSGTTLSLGDTYVKDGVSFTLHDFRFAKRVDGETYDAKTIDGIAFVPNDGYVFAYISYTIDNGGKEAFSHFMDLNIVLEYGDGYIYGDSQLDYKATCTEKDKYNLDVDPLMSKTYHHVITNCPESIANSGDVKIKVKMDGKTVTFLIPSSK